MKSHSILKKVPLLQFLSAADLEDLSLSLIELGREFGVKDKNVLRIGLRQISRKAGELVHLGISFF